MLPKSTPQRRASEYEGLYQPAVCRVDRVITSPIKARVSRLDALQPVASGGYREVERARSL
jgi:hypothetical protein